ncbi:MAG: VWA domain-containing protein [Deltaproteobacteria bacterium]|nr:VWA domain-containing protein [Deltaproteobacteria bacterium]MBW2253553.1 VWA domain-containing protein [Deltaproteobacteria bacterium]
MMMPVVLGFAALGVDLSFMQLTELQSQYAADAAAHAAFVRYRATGDPTQGVAAAEYMLSQNLVGGAPAELHHLHYGSWTNGVFDNGDPEANAVEAHVQRKNSNAIPLFFAGFLGHPTQEVESWSVTAGHPRQIMMVQDITGSFRDDIDKARVADLAFLDYLLEHPYPNDMIGMSTFVGGVQATAWSPLEYTSTGADIYAHWQKLDWCNCHQDALQDYFGNPEDWCTGSLCPVPSWQEYCDVYGEGHNMRPSMVDCWSVGVNTAPGPGIDQAVDELLARGEEKAFRAIILVSDGLPCCGADTEPREAAAVVAADRAWANGIHVWSVAFNNGGGDFAFLQSLSRGMGRAYETPDAAALQGILLEIAASIPVLTVQ